MSNYSDRLKSNNRKLSEVKADILINKEYTNEISEKIKSDENMCTFYISYTNADGELVNDEDVRAPKTMTWGEWCYSPYNTIMNKTHEILKVKNITYKENGTTVTNDLITLENNMYLFDCEDNIISADTVIYSGNFAAGVTGYDHFNIAEAPDHYEF